MPGIGRVDQVHDELVSNLERLQAARTPRERLVLTVWAAPTNQGELALAQVTLDAREVMEQEPSAQRAHLHALGCRVSVQRRQVLADQFGKAKKA